MSEYHLIKNKRNKIASKPGRLGRLLSSINVEHDIRLHRTSSDTQSAKRFETRKAARAEHSHRIRTLRRGENTECTATADRLEKCSSRGRCRSMACPMCARIRRILRVADCLRYCDKFHDAELGFITLIDPADAVSDENLGSFNPSKCKDRLRRRLDRLDFDRTNCFMIGGIDGEFDVHTRLYQPHWHIMSYGLKRHDLKSLVDNWDKDCQRVRVRQKMISIKEGTLARVASYSEKGFWGAVERLTTSDQRRSFRKRRLPQQQEREFLNWIDGCNPTEFRLSYGCRL